ncbi:MAG TPA: hypothetical protein VIH86_09045 [Puia sp.]
MKNSTRRRKIAIIGFACSLAATSFLFSCKKDNTSAMISQNKFDEAAKILDGTKLTGSMTSSISENELAINYNNGSQYILIDEIPGSGKININSNESSELIISKYGLIINDKSNGKILLLPNNDEESIQKFETVKLLLKNNYESSLIFGTTILNSENS